MAGFSKALPLHVLLYCLCRGLANIKCSGHVWIEPAGVVLMGTNISINCLSTLGCPGAQFLILLNNSQTGTPLHPLNSSTVQLRLPRFQVPFWTITCFAHCPNSARRQLVCGANLRAGYPPDPPGNVSCAIQERSEQLECQWDAGRPTELSTRYSLHLSRVRTSGVDDAEEENKEDEEEEIIFPVDSPVPLNTLHGATHYSVWVQASNELGTARSTPRSINLQELVVPALPLVDGAETMETSPPTTTIHWRRQTLLENVHCEERHKATGSLAWHVEMWDGAEQHEARSQHNLQSDTQYVFQVRCQLSSANSPWSPWSPPFLYTTPEAAPAAAPDVWRRLGWSFPNGSHEVTVLIKPLPPQDARGRILGYTVTTKSPEGALLLCNTSGTECSVLVPPGARVLHITAHNSKGASSPASITLSGQEDFPAPGAVEVEPVNGSRVLVAWKPPPHHGRSPQWFIVEWVSTPQHSLEEQYLWKKVPRQKTHTDIQDKAAAGGHIKVSVYAVYPDGVSKPSSGQLPAEDQLLGSTSTEFSHEDDISTFLGLGVSIVTLSVAFLILMFKKSARKRISATVVSFLPKWMVEDFPHVENSNVVKSLQEKSDFPGYSFHEPFLGSSDPKLTAIEEMPVHEEQVATSRQPSTEVLEEEKHPRSSAPASTTHLEQISDYKPQVSEGNTLGYVAANIYQAQPPAALPDPETNLFFRDYTSPFPQLWDLEGGGHHVCLLEKINLILNSSRSGQSLVFSSAQGGQGSPLESHWGQGSPLESHWGQGSPLESHWGQGSPLESHWGPALADDAQEQMLVPNEMLSCLRAMNGESVDIKTCFPQSMGRLL